MKIIKKRTLIFLWQVGLVALINVMVILMLAVSSGDVPFHG